MGRETRVGTGCVGVRLLHPASVGVPGRECHRRPQFRQTGSSAVTFLEGLKVKPMRRIAVLMSISGLMSFVLVVIGGATAHAGEVGCTDSTVTRCVSFFKHGGYLNAQALIVESYDRYRVATTDLRLERKESNGDYITVAIVGDYDGWQNHTDTSSARSNICGTYRAVAHFTWRHDATGQTREETRFGWPINHCG